jgi:hypothetical protein
VYSLIAPFLVLPPMLVLWAAYDHWRATEIAAQLGAEEARGADS